VIGVSGNNTVDYCRVKAYECVRVSNAPNTPVTFNNCFFQVVGPGPSGAHQDGVQFYVGGGSKGGTANFNNTMIQFDKAAWLTGTSGMFVSDGWGGRINFNQVIFKMGPYGLRLAANGSGVVIDAYINGLYFVGPFKFGAYLFQSLNGGKLNIKQWENVYHAMIDANGKLIPGAPILSP
jgi:hypothetical protein